MVESFMEFIKRNYFSISVMGLAVLYFTLRLNNILSLPIFTDEAIYVRWSQIASNDASWRFISLTDGKQPSFVWIAMILMKFISDPLLAGRLVSVFAGVGSVIGIYFLGSELFKDRKIGLLASLIYVVFPFALVYDRLALYDSLVGMFIIWAMYLEVLLVRKPRLDTALILGMVIGAGMLTKTSNNFAFILLPFSLLLFDFKNKKWKENLKNWIVFALIAVGLSQVMYAILRLSPFYHIVSDKNAVFVYPISEWIRSPFAFFTGNIKGLTSWLFTYMSYPFIVLVVSSFLIDKKTFRKKLFLLVWFAAPFFALALFGKVIYPRFILFMSMPLLLLGAYALFNLVRTAEKKWMKITIPFVFLVGFIINDYFIVTDFSKASIPTADREQFITDWPAGVGVKETVEFLRQASSNEKLFVATQGTFGLMPYALEIYLSDNPNIEIKGYWPIEDHLSQEILEKSKEKKTYFIFYQPCPPCMKTGVAPSQYPLKEVFQIEKEQMGSYYTLYEVQNL